VDPLTQRPGEAALCLRPLEAGEAAAGVGAAPTFEATSLEASGHELPVARDEAQQLPLGSATAAAHAAPDRLCHYSAARGSSSGGSGSSESVGAGSVTAGDGSSATAVAVPAVAASGEVSSAAGAGASAGLPPT